MSCSTDPERRRSTSSWNLVPTEGTSYVRGQLGRVLFSGDDVGKRVGTLSGGEAARLVFCSIMVARPNVLVLDEPTNHLDLESIHALVEALRAFEGTLLVRVARSRVRLRARDPDPRGDRGRLPRFPRELRRVPGEVRGRSPRRRRRRPPREEAAASGRAKAAKTEASALSWEEQKRRANRQKQLPARRDKVIGRDRGSGGAEGGDPGPLVRPGTRSER